MLAIDHAQVVTDAEFSVVRGPYRQGEKRRKRTGWAFTGLYNREGDPLFYNKLHDPGWWYRSIARWLWIAIAATVGSLLLAMLIGGLFFGAFR